MIHRAMSYSLFFTLNALPAAGQNPGCNVTGKVTLPPYKLCIYPVAVKKTNTQIARKNVVISPGIYIPLLAGGRCMHASPFYGIPYSQATRTAAGPGTRLTIIC